MADIQMDRLEIVIQAQAKQTIKDVDALYSSMTRLSVAITGTSKSLGNSEKASNKLTNSLRNLGRVAGSISGSALKASTSFVKLFWGLSNGTKAANQATFGFRSLLRAIIPLYGIRGIFNWGKEAIELSSSLTEVQNVVENAFGKNGVAAVENFTKTSIKQFGLAELAAKQISSRYQSMGIAMGITTGQVADATANVASRMDDSYDKIGDTMGAMSLNLTKLAADMASFYNVEQDVAATALNSVFTGQTRPLRQFGLDLTQATLQEWAMKQGLDANIASMSQAEKTMLRYQYVMANTSIVQGDFARTSETWANQVRILKQNFEVFSRTIGNVLINVFKPLVMWLNTAMSKVIAFAETVGNALGKIFGWTILHTPSGSLADEYDTMSDSVDSIGDAGNSASDGLTKANKAAKALQATILGFDQINRLNGDTSTPGTTTGSGSGDGTGSGTGGAVGGSGVDFELVKTQSWREAYESHIDSLFGLGEYISNTLKKMLDSIDWEKAYRGAEKFGVGLASFLNGLIKPGLFESLGRTVSNAINTSLQFLNTFGDIFSWSNFGKSLGTGIRSFFANFDWQLSAQTFATFRNGFFTAFEAMIDEIPFSAIGATIRNSILVALSGIKWEIAFRGANKFGTGLAEFLNSSITPQLFDKVGETLANTLSTAVSFLNTFGNTLKEKGTFRRMGISISAAINAFFRTFTFEDLANAINVWAEGILTTINNILVNTDWKKIGQTIGQFLRDINWVAWFTAAGQAIGNAINAIIDFAIGIIDPTGLGTPLTEALDGIRKAAADFRDAVDWDKLATNIGRVVKALEPAAEGFAQGMVDAFTNIGKLGVTVLDAIGKVFSAIADALEKLPPDVLTEFGNVMGKVAAAFVVIKGAQSVANIFSSVVGSVLGLGSAASSAGTHVGGLFGNIKRLGNTLGESAGVTALFSQQIEILANVDRDNAISALANVVSTLGQNMGLTADESFKLANEVSNLQWQNASLEEVVSKTAEVLRKQGVTAADLEGDMNSLGTAFSFAGINAEDQAAILESLKSALGTTSDVTEDLATDTEDADKKTVSFKGALWEFAGGMAVKALLMAVMGNAFTDMGDDADDASDKIGGLSGMVDTVISNIKNKVNGAKEAGKGFSEGLGDGAIEGIEDQRQEIINSLMTTSDGMASALGSYWDMHSPSKKMKQYGWYLDEGLTNGITEMAPVPTSALRRVMEQLEGVVTGFKDKFYSAGADISKSLRSGMESISINDTFNSMFDFSVFRNLNDKLYDAGRNAAQSLRNGMKSVYMPKLNYYISDWRYHSHGNGGGSYTPVYSPQWYKTGGFPNRGEIFIANENGSGTEMIGRMGQRNVVANNLQITEGIREAVVDGMMQVGMSGVLGNNNNAPFVLNAVLKTESDEVLARAVQRGQMRRNERFNTVAATQ